MRKTLLSTGILIIVLACNETTKSRTTVFPSKIDSIDYKLWLRPSWAEACYVHISKVDTLCTLQILLRNNQRADELQDTFYYKSQYLSTASWNYLDSSIMTKSKTRIPIDYKVTVDGTSLGIHLNYKGDTNWLYLQSPDIKDSLEYNIAVTTLERIQHVSNDTIIDNYFDDVIPYIDRTRNRLMDYSRPLFKLREAKYNWMYRR